MKKGPARGKTKIKKQRARDLLPRAAKPSLQDRSGKRPRKYDHGKGRKSPYHRGDVGRPNCKESKQCSFGKRHNEEGGIGEHEDDRGDLEERRQRGLDRSDNVEKGEIKEKDQKKQKRREEEI